MPFLPGPPDVWQVLLIPSGLLPLENPSLSSLSSSASLRYENLPSIFYILRNSTMPSFSSLYPSSMLFSPLSFFHSWKVNNQLSMQIDFFPLACPEPIKQPLCSQIVPSLSMSAKVCSLTETILLLGALLKERTPMPPSSQQPPPL